MYLHYVTFISPHPFEGHWVEMIAEDGVTAERAAHRTFPGLVSACYDAIEFNSWNNTAFPGGKLMRLKAWECGDEILVRVIRDDEHLGLELHTAGEYGEIEDLF